MAFAYLDIWPVASACALVLGPTIPGEAFGIVPQFSPNPAGPLFHIFYLNRKCIQVPCADYLSYLPAICPIPFHLVPEAFFSQRNSFPVV